MQLSAKRQPALESMAQTSARISTNASISIKKINVAQRSYTEHCSWICGCSDKRFLSASPAKSIWNNESSSVKKSKLHSAASVHCCIWNYCCSNKRSSSVSTATSIWTNASSSSQKFSIAQRSYTVAVGFLVVQTKCLWVSVQPHRFETTHLARVKNSTLHSAVTLLQLDFLLFRQNVFECQYSHIDLNLRI